jgi:hypothetical protein
MTYALPRKALVGSPRLSSVAVPHWFEKGDLIMGMIELILTVCALGQPASCDEQYLTFVDQGQTLMQCMMQAPPTIAQWSNEHPNRIVAKWRCSYPGKESRDL